MQLTITQLHRDRPYIVTGEGDLLHSFSNFDQLVAYLADEFVTEVNDNSSLIDDLEKELKEAESDFEELQKDNAKLEETISTLETTIHNLQAQCNTSPSLPSVVIPTDTAPTSTSTPS